MLSGLCALLFLLIPVAVSAQIKINELSPFATSDWIEVINVSTSSVSLSSYMLIDEAGNSKKLTGELLPNEIKSLGYSNYLNREKDKVSLVDAADGKILDSVYWGDEGGMCIPSETQSIGRYPDGDDGFFLINTASPNLPNSSDIAACIVTPAPSDSLNISQSPVPTNSPTAYSPTAIPVTVTDIIIPNTSKKSLTPKPIQFQLSAPAKKSENIVLLMNNSVLPDYEKITIPPGKTVIPRNFGRIRILAGLGIISSVAAAVVFIYNTITKK